MLEPFKLGEDSKKVDLSSEGEWINDSLNKFGDITKENLNCSLLCYKSTPWKRLMCLNGRAKWRIPRTSVN